MKKIGLLITKKILVIFNVIVILILIVEINYPGNITEYLFAWLLFLAPLVIFDIILFYIYKFYKNPFDIIKKDVRMMAGNAKKKSNYLADLFLRILRLGTYIAAIIFILTSHDWKKIIVAFLINAGLIWLEGILIKKFGVEHCEK